VSGTTSSSSSQFEVVVRKGPTEINTSEGETGDEFRLRGPDGYAKYEWDFDGDGVVDITKTTNEVQTYSWSKAGSFGLRLCVTRADGTKLYGARPVMIFAKPPEGEVGASILDGESYTNTKSVKLRVVWPVGADTIKVSNDGGFAAARTKEFTLNEYLEWDLDDSVIGVFTKVVYVRIYGHLKTSPITYQDDIILDTTRPVVLEADALQTTNPSGGTVDVFAVGSTMGRVVRARLKIQGSDTISGISAVDVRLSPKSAPTRVVLKSPPGGTSRKLIRSSGVVNVRTSGKQVQVRVVDRAGNVSAWKTVKIKSGS
jgi:hypothetical protein